MTRNRGGDESAPPESSGARVEHEFSDEIAAHHRRPNWNTTQNGLIGRAWIERFWQLPDSDYQFEKRDVFLLIEKDNCLLAAAALTVWRGTFDEDGIWGDLQDFVDRADLGSVSEYNTALAVARIWGSDDKRYWGTDDPFCTGDLCIFDRLLIDAETSADIEAVWQIIGALLTRIRRQVAVMVLKAFPLEYEDNVTEENQLAFANRQRALIRLYRRRLRAELVPHRELAEAGWMLHLFKDGARPDPDA